MNLFADHAWTPRTRRTAPPPGPAVRPEVARLGQGTLLWLICAWPPEGHRG